jgi:hypothetical protein
MDLHDDEEGQDGQEDDEEEGDDHLEQERSWVAASTSAGGPRF